MKLSHGNAWILGAVVTLILAVVPAVLWPGSVSWMCDEPMLLGQACLCNQGHQLASRGLNGTLVVPYGPFAIQFYQFLLLITHDLRVIVVLHGLFLSGLMAGSLLWLSRTLRLTPWFAAAIVMAPYLWWSQRVLWDASFALPIGMFGMAAYAAHLRRPSAICLGLAVLALSLTPLIHLQALPLFAAFAFHALIHFWPQRRQWKLVPVAIAMVLILDHRYIHEVCSFLMPRLHTVFHSGYDDHTTQTPAIISAMGPFLSGRLFDGKAFSDAQHHSSSGPLLTALSLWISRLAIPLICGGIIVAVATWRRQVRIHPPAAPSSSDAPDISVAQARSSLSAIALGALVMQMLLASSLHVPPLPQYCFGTFPIHVFFGWLAIDFLQRYRMGISVAVIWGSSLAFITLGALWDAHAHGWILSPSLENQIQIAEQLNEYADESVLTNVGLYQKYPVAMRSLRLIMPPPAGAVRHSSPHGLVIRSVGDPAFNSRIELVERNGEPLNAAEYQPLDVTPMEKLMPPVGWED